ncbi:transposase [Bradyrhizobium sp. LB14.3]
MATTDTLPDDAGTLKAMLLAERARAETAGANHQGVAASPLGRRAEALPEDQLLLSLEEVEQTAASTEAENEAAAPTERASHAAKRRINRGSLPAHLPRIEVVVDIDDKSCPCCKGELHRIGEDKSERLDIVPAQFRVLVIRRPKYACRSCRDGVLQAPAPARLIEGGLPTEATVAQVLVSADHLPLYRQAQIYARQGITLDRSTLADWVGRAAFLLRPVHERLLGRLKGSTKLFADETTATVLNPGRGKTKTGRLWAYARDDHPSGDADPPGVAYVYAPIARRSGRSPISLGSLAPFRSMATPAIAYSPSAATCDWHSAGRMCADASRNSLRPARRRSPARRSDASPGSMPSRAISVAAALRKDATPGCRGAGRSSMSLNPGCTPSSL